MVGGGLACGRMILASWEVSGLVEKGGPLVWVLFALAFFGAVCVVERMFFFHRARINVSTLLVGLSLHVKRRSYAEALHEAARAPGPFAEKRSKASGNPYSCVEPTSGKKHGSIHR